MKPTDMDYLQTKEKLAKVRAELAESKRELASCEEERSNLARAVLKLGERVRNQERPDTDLLDCKHPGCCCVCGHQGRCPEDGPSAIGPEHAEKESKNG